VAKATQKNRPSYVLRLYVAGASPNSVKAQENLRLLVDEHLHDACKIEVVDVLREPDRALEDNVLVTPTLVKLSPIPVRKLIGDLSETEITLATLGVPFEEKKRP
jgi:circadian clock protein KaiB